MTDKENDKIKSTSTQMIQNSNLMRCVYSKIKKKKYENAEYGKKNQKVLDQNCFIFGFIFTKKEIDLKKKKYEQKWTKKMYPFYYT